MIFSGRNRVRYNYARWGWTRGGGKTWHGGLDVEGLDDTTIRMPFYCGKAIRGTVTRARRITDKSNKTWEWGWYVCVKLAAKQTSDAVNYLYFCHCDHLLVGVGDEVCSGAALAVMGNTGNAALAIPAYAHCHFEVRAGCNGGKGLDPTAYVGFANAVGTYGAELVVEPATDTASVIVRQGTWYLRNTPATSGAILGTVKGGARLCYTEISEGWYHMSGGWLAGAAVESDIPATEPVTNTGATYLLTPCPSAGDVASITAYCAGLGIAFAAQEAD